jgi:hypothetical protein
MRGTDRSRAERVSYPSLASFYSADSRRVASRELDVGLWWREHAQGPLHRAAWVRDTGELYLVRLGSEQEGGGAVEVLADVSERDVLERAFEGWREHCGEPGSLGWLRARARRVGVRSQRPRRLCGLAAGLR